ncbi:Adhesin [Pararobbsia alpina]|uniref:hypothetical protein n=1 Tax=Pararobbsia alpina TaxID=621374 RepID=UPI0039A4D629
MRFKHDGVRTVAVVAAIAALAGCYASAAVAGPTDDTGNVFGSGLIASVGTDALSHVTGNVGINIAAGTRNQQSNSLTIVQSSSEATAGGTGNPSPATSVTVNETQTVGGHDAGMTPVRVEIASLGAGALSHAVGNIGVNIAAGSGNLQQNVIVSR